MVPQDADDLDESYFGTRPTTLPPQEIEPVEDDGRFSRRHKAVDADTSTSNAGRWLIPPLVPTLGAFIVAIPELKVLRRSEPSSVQL